MNLTNLQIPRDALFSLREKAKPESLDFIQVDDIGITKFYPIILKEALIYCKVNGFIIIKLANQKLISFNTLLKQATNLFQEKASLRKQDRKNRILVFQKTKDFLQKKDSINKWSFGIITNGEKEIRFLHLFRY